LSKLVFVVAISVMPWLGHVAAAQQPTCAQHAMLLDLLRSNFFETPVAIGLDEAGRLVEILASPAGTWTVLMTVPGGPTCMITSGRDWQHLIPAARTPAA